MFKRITALLRGRVGDAETAFSDAQALPLLRQQLRDATVGLEAAQRAVAVVVAYHKREQNRTDDIAERLTDLETRTRAALAQEKDALAHEGATAIAELEQEREASRAVLAGYETEIRRLREDVTLAQRRLRALQRGKTLAEATAATQKLRGTMPAGVTASLREAEETLARLQARQTHAADAAAAYADLSAEGSAETASDRLASAGCGPRKQSDAESVLARLRGATSSLPA
ncbi:PspA/IM30 family protein [Palleronia caenipelagi]|nr:PspA/IM30 family protein [Palleronia caenipelagi]